MNKKIKDFTDLVAWQESHRLTILIYKITGYFPKSELFSLTNQMRRASVSVGSNISEGFSRQGYKEKIQFYYIAQGSLVELKNQLYISRDVGYLEKENFSLAMVQANSAHKLLQGLITKIKILNT